MRDQSRSTEFLKSLAERNVKKYSERRDNWRWKFFSSAGIVGLMHVYVANFMANPPVGQIEGVVGFGSLGLFGLSYTALFATTLVSALPYWINSVKLSGARDDLEKYSKLQGV